MKIKIGTLGLISIIFIGCQHSNKKSQSVSEVESTVQPNHEKPSDLLSDTISDYSLIHFWENFDFSDEVRMLDPEYGEQNFVNYINEFSKSNPQSISQSVKNLIDKSSADEVVQSYFEELLKKYLYDVNSPFYNEYYYTLALEQLINSEHVDINYKKKYKIILQTANKNKIGDIAQDFEYVTNNGSHKLSDHKTNYIILFFYDPGCQLCNSIIQDLKINDYINSKLKGNLTLLAIYPEGDKKKWLEYNDRIPKNWINGLDIEQKILRQGLYDLKASPTIYLLDKNKKVLLKDAEIQQVIHYLKESK